MACSPNCNILLQSGSAMLLVNQLGSARIPSVISEATGYGVHCKVLFGERNDVVNAECTPSEYCPSIILYIKENPDNFQQLFDWTHCECLLEYPILTASGLLQLQTAAFEECGLFVCNVFDSQCPPPHKVYTPINYWLHIKIGLPFTQSTPRVFNIST